MGLRASECEHSNVVVSDHHKVCVLQTLSWGHGMHLQN